MSFTVPTSWGDLTQEQLRRMFRLLWLYGESPEWENRVKVAAFLYFSGVEVARKTGQGWLCRERNTAHTFLLDPQLLPSVVEPLDWLCHAEQLTVRIERIGIYKAVDFRLQEFPFGDYLKVENRYQSYLQGRNEENLAAMARLLYGIPDDEEVEELREEVLTGTFLWFNAVKQLLARQFPDFLKSSEEEGATVTQQNLIESMRAQIRLLTKGDVTKQKHILEDIDTWTALAELNALAREAAEIKNKYGKK
ncbi:MAG: hypothetical protein IKQ47_07580 [Prevotella sp.]|nr:hypothetical protein [Prevotella sp.]